MTIHFDDTTATWRALLRAILSEGREVAPASPGSEWRGRATRELLAHTAVVDASAPVVRCPGRKLFMKYLVAEAAWVLSGDSRVATLAPFAPRKLRDFSDDGVRFAGAYGPRFVEQLSYVVSTLAADPASRQAVVQVFRPIPRASKDVPCTLSWQYLIRDGHLHTVATMRSSDAWSGWVYDVFTFSMTAAAVALELRAREVPTVGPDHNEVTRVKPFGGLRLGSLRLTAGSQHLYKLDFDAARECQKLGPGSLDYAPLDLDEFDSPDALIGHLWALAGKGGSGHKFLTELMGAGK